MSFKYLKQITNVNIEFMDNGYTMRYDGYDGTDDDAEFTEVRLVMTNIDEVNEHLKFISLNSKGYEHD